MCSTIRVEATSEGTVRVWSRRGSRGRNEGVVRLQMVDELEEFLRQGDFWDDDEMGGLLGRLEDESAATGDAVALALARALRSLVLRKQSGEVSRRLSHEVEGVLVPRLWKVMEGARRGLPDAELRTRVDGINRGLARLFVADGSP